MRVKKIDGKLNIIGGNLRKYRELKGYSLRDLSIRLELFGLTIYHTDIHNIEHGLKTVRDYEIKGYVFMPKIGKRSRVLSDILNGKKRFVAIKDCEVAYRLMPNRRTEFHDFVQLNINSIIILRPTSNEE